MARRLANRLLGVLMDEAGVNAAELAREVVRLGAVQGFELSYDRTAPAHWLTGSRPREPVPDLVAEVFSQRLGRLVTAAETGLVGEKRRAPARCARSPQAHGADGVAALRQMIEVCRASLSPEQGPAVTRLVYGTRPYRPPRWEQRRRVKRPSPLAVTGATTLNDLVRSFAALTARHGGGQVRPVLSASLAYGVRPALVRGERELLTGYAQMAHLLGAATSDCGMQGLGQRHFELGLEMAREAANRNQYAVTLRAMSAQALLLGYQEQASQFAEGAVEQAGSSAPASVRSYVLVQRSMTLAAGGLRRRALMDLAAAEREHDRAARGVGPFSGYPRSGLDYQRACALKTLGCRTQAAAAFHEAIRNRAAAQHRPYALMHARLAEVLCAMGHLDEACAQWGVFLDHRPLVWSARVEQAAGRMRELLRRFRSDQRVVALLERATDNG